MSRIENQQNGYNRRDRDKLTARQMEVLELIADGDTSKEIAPKLEIEIKTVESHVTAILLKLDAKTRAHAVKIAFERGILKCPKKHE